MGLHYAAEISDEEACFRDLQAIGVLAVKDRHLSPEIGRCPPEWLQLFCAALQLFSPLTFRNTKQGRGGRGRGRAARGAARGAAAEGALNAFSQLRTQTEKRQMKDEDVKSVLLEWLGVPNVDLNAKKRPATAE